MNRPDGTRRGPPAGLGIVAAILPLYVLVPLLALPLVVGPRALLEHLASAHVLQALALTLRTTIASTLLCAVLGLPLAFLLARYRFPGRRVLDTLLDLPLTIPPVVAGLALLLVFGRRGLLGGVLDLAGIQIPFTSVAVVMAQVFIACPFFVRTATSGLAAVNPSLERTARTLGATPWRVFYSVTVPLARPALASATVLAWARSLSEFGATMMFAGNLRGRTQTLPLAAMSALEGDIDSAVAVSLISLALAAGSLFLARHLAGAQERGGRA